MTAVAKGIQVSLIAYPYRADREHYRRTAHCLDVRAAPPFLVSAGPTDPFLIYGRLRDEFRSTKMNSESKSPFGLRKRRAQISAIREGSRGGQRY